MTPHPPRVSRRALAAGAVWSVPVVVAAAPAPASAASALSTATYGCSTTPTGKVYKTTVNICNNTTVPMTISIPSAPSSSYVINGTIQLTPDPTTPVSPSVVPAGTCQNVVFTGSSGSNASVASVTVIYTWAATGQTPSTGTVTVTSTTPTTCV